MAEIDLAKMDRKDFERIDAASSVLAVAICQAISCFTAAHEDMRQMSGSDLATTIAFGIGKLLGRHEFASGSASAIERLHANMPLYAKVAHYQLQAMIDMEKGVPAGATVN